MTDYCKLRESDPTAVRPNTLIQIRWFDLTEDNL